MLVEDLAHLAAALEHDTAELERLTSSTLTAACDWTASAIFADAIAAGWLDLAERQMWALHEIGRMAQGMLVEVGVRAQIRALSLAIGETHRRHGHCRDTAGACRAQAAARKLSVSPEMTRAFAEQIDSQEGAG